MSWREAATVLFFLFFIAMMQSVAGPIAGGVVGTLQDSGDYSNEHFDGEKEMNDMIDGLFNGFLVAIFGVMLWGVARVVRKERFRGLR